VLGCMMYRKAKRHQRCHAAQPGRDTVRLPVADGCPLGDEVFLLLEPLLFACIVHMNVDVRGSMSPTQHQVYAYGIPGMSPQAKLGKAATSCP